MQIRWNITQNKSVDKEITQLTQNQAQKKKKNNNPLQRLKHSLKILSRVQAACIQMYRQSAIIYVSAAVFSACTIAGNCNTAVKQQGFACNLRSPNELQSYGTTSFMPRHDGRCIIKTWSLHSWVSPPSRMITAEHDHQTDTHIYRFPLSYNI